ncbi:conserved exported hypothetical protein [Pseudoclavibacter sp. 8L]|nr:conserved exported hypothetical protein [Pseudoclavibacter sp. 8L]
MPLYDGSIGELRSRKAPLMPKHTFAKSLALGATAAAAIALVAAAPATAETEVAEPDSFTSAYTVMATPDAVINNDGDVTPGEPGAMGQFDFRINSDLNIICYDITLTGVTGEYESPAKTATHIHEAAEGQAGPPRIAFPNPTDNGDGTRTSSGCLEGPFTTGLNSDAGADTGEGFTLKQIEANPAGFTGDSHTADFKAGVVRGQLVQVPVGGVDTGAGGAAAAGGLDAMTLSFLGLGGLAVAGVAGLAVARKARAAGQ